ncbi:MAG TPA: hypothetical protein VFE24_17310, partial [Pirellulales bacterium]|nr:hypothetical protein [Pirellulales bacterium]
TGIVFTVIAAIAQSKWFMTFSLIWTLLSPITGIFWYLKKSRGLLAPTPFDCWWEFRELAALRAQQFADAEADVQIDGEAAAEVDLNVPAPSPGAAV